MSAHVVTRLEMTRRLAEEAVGLVEADHSPKHGCPRCQRLLEFASVLRDDTCWEYVDGWSSEVLRQPVLQQLVQSWGGSIHGS